MVVQIQFVAVYSYRGSVVLLIVDLKGRIIELIQTESYSVVICAYISNRLVVVFGVDYGVFEHDFFIYQFHDYILLRNELVFNDLSVFHILVMCIPLHLTPKIIALKFVFATMPNTGYTSLANRAY